MRHSIRDHLVACCGALAFSCGSATPAREAALAPTFSPPEALRFRSTLPVTLATATGGATIHYTTDGSAPTAASPPYTAPLTLDATTTLRAVATRAGLDDSPVSEITYTRRAVELALDDGTVENWAGFGREAGDLFFVLDRFTPDPADYPFQLRTISIQVPNLAGTPIRLAVFSDPDGSPANGATLEASFDVTLQAGWAWSVHELDPPVTLRGPGDVLIAHLADQGVFFGLDETTVSGRTWSGFWPDAASAQGLLLQASTGYGVLEDLAPMSGTALIRGSN